MTETEWLEGKDPRKMLSFVAHRLKERTVRRFAILACRAGPTLGAHESIEEAIDTAEALIDGAVAENVLAEARDYIQWGIWEMCESLNNLATAASVALGSDLQPVTAAELVVDSLAAIYPLIGWEGRECESDRSQAVLLRELIPFRPTTFAPEWRTDTAVALAAQMYESRDFGAMPILADALQDAGCDNDDTLAHCRDPHTTHVRGCWVVDLVLGKE